VTPGEEGNLRLSTTADDLRKENKKGSYEIIIESELTFLGVLYFLLMIFTFSSHSDPLDN